MIDKITNSAAETMQFAETVGELLNGGDIILYAGGLGAGKTTFTRGLAMGMGLNDVVSSPTFAIVNEYKGKDITLYHFDMYRINSIEALETTGFYDYVSDNAVMAVEWPENIPEAFDGMAGIITVTIEYTGEETRKINIEGDARFDSPWN